MAKTSSIIKERKKVKLVQSGEKKRAELRKAGKYVELQKLPRNTSRIRVTNRCQLCGRPKAVYRRFEMCRICIRNLLMNGDIPGGVKSSW